MLEDAGYIVSTHTNGDWVLTTPKGKKIVFKRDTGVCKGMPYINLREHKELISMIKTVRKKYAGATKRDIEKAIQSRTLQRIIGHPPDERFKEIVSLGENGLRNCPLEVADISNSNVIFGLNHPIIRGQRRGARNYSERRSKELGSHGISTSYTRWSLSRLMSCLLVGYLFWSRFQERSNFERLNSYQNRQRD